MYVESGPSLTPPLLTPDSGSGRYTSSIYLDEWEGEWVGVSPSKRHRVHRRRSHPNGPPYYQYVSTGRCPRLGSHRSDLLPHPVRPIGPTVETIDSLSTHSLPHRHRHTHIHSLTHKRPRSIHKQSLPTHTQTPVPLPLSPVGTPVPPHPHSSRSLHRRRPCPLRTPCTHRTLDCDADLPKTFQKQTELIFLSRKKRNSDLFIKKGKRRNQEKYIVKQFEAVFVCVCLFGFSEELTQVPRPPCRLDTPRRHVLAPRAT